MAEWVDPEQFVREEVSVPDKDDLRSPNDIHSGRAIRGDIHPGAADRQEIFLPRRGSYVRCPGCGGKVIMPCLSCRISNLTIVPGEFEKLLEQVPIDEEKERMKSAIHSRSRSRRGSVQVPTRLASNDSDSQ